MCNYLADFVSDNPLMIFWAVNIDAVFTECENNS